MKFRIQKTNVLWFGLLITILSILINLLFFAISHVFSEKFNIPITDSLSNFAPIPVQMIVLATGVPAILTMVLYIFLKKVLPHSFITSFLSVTITAFLVSLGGPLDIPGAEIKTKILLGSMHFISAIIIIGGWMIFYFQNKKIVKEGNNK